MNHYRIDKFWNWFRDFATELERTRGMHPKGALEFLGPLHDELAAYSPGLGIDIIHSIEIDNPNMEVIITGHGHRKMFKRIEKLIQRAPQIECLTIRALHPPYPIDHKVEEFFPGLNINYQKIWFTYTIASRETERLWMEVFIEYYGKISKELMDAVVCVVYNLLGEEKYGHGIEHMTLRSIFELEPAERETLIHISELPAHVDSREIAPQR